MQLPRGTFCEIKKGIPIPVLLSDIQTKHFSGICTISSGSSSGTFVFRLGTCILAKFMDKRGDHAWQSLIDMQEKTVDAALSSLDEAQIKLSLEFNKTSRIAAPRAGLPVREISRSAPPETAASTKKKTSHHRLVTLSEIPSVEKNRKKTSSAAFDQLPETKTGAIKPQENLDLFEDELLPVLPVPAGPNPPEDRDRKIAAEKAQPACTEPDSFEDDINTINEMDLERVSEKIRSDCKTLVKSLELEHLMKDDKQ